MLDFCLRQKIIFEYGSELSICSIIYEQLIHLEEAA